MSLGRYRGAALIGRPLDISVQAILGAQDDPAALCIEADAFYADNRLDKALVRVSTEKVLSNPVDTLIRIRSSVPVDEPVVTLIVRVGCQQTTERRYVILADLASEPAGLPLQLPTAGADDSKLSAPLTTRGESSAGTSASAGSSASSAAAKRSDARRNSARPVATASSGSGIGSDPAATEQGTSPAFPKDKTSVARRDKLKSTGTSASGQTNAGKARLKLEPLDLSIERDPQLKSSMELLSVPAVGEPQRSAAAALWRALSAQPQDIVRDTEKIQSLENSLSTVRAQSQKNQLLTNELNSQLEKTRSERYANWLVYALGMLLVVALIGLAYIWRLRTSPKASATSELPWWRKNKPLEKGWTSDLQDSAFPASAGSVVSEKQSSPATTKKEKNKAQSRSAFLNSDAGLGLDESSFTEVRHISGLGAESQFSPSSSLDFTVSMPPVARAAKAEELFDVQQQADFFVSLGQYEQAVDVLRGHIAGNTPTSPLVYMDLFNLYHRLDRQADYEALRKEFNQLFTGKIPAFELYTDASAGLDAYPVALTRIEALWPSPKVLEVIEESILRRPVASADAFDLEAYRELLLLYAIAKEIIHPEGSHTPDVLQFDLPAVSVEDNEVPPSGFSLTSIQPLSAVARGSSVKGVDLMLPTELARLPLDVNLDDLGDTGNSPLADAGTPPSSNSNFFARLGTKMPVASSPRSPAPGASPAHPVGVDNLIDFDDFDDFFKKPDATEPPKV